MSNIRKSVLLREWQNIEIPGFIFLCGFGKCSLKVANMIPDLVLIANDNSICTTCYLSGYTFFLVSFFWHEGCINCECGSSRLRWRQAVIHFRWGRALMSLSSRLLCSGHPFFPTRLPPAPHDSWKAQHAVLNLRTGEIEGWRQNESREETGSDSQGWGGGEDLPGKE